MNKNIELVQKYNEAFAKQDIETVCSYLHENFTFEGPMMQFSSKKEFAAGMKGCPFECSNQNVRFISDGDNIVQIFDWKVTSPFKGNIPMCEWLVIKDNKIHSSRLFFDTAKFPSEVMEQMKTATAV